jgi:radical SAM/SPASM domain protein of ACGX system
MEKQLFAFQWHITDDCDQRCKHCYIFSENNKKPIISMTLNEMKSVLSNCLEFCNRFNREPYFYITGGDPILHPDFWELMKLIKKTGAEFTILGNPFHLTDEVCKKLRDFGCDKYQMSLDGMRETHDWFRKKGSFDTTLEKIKCINNAGINSVVMTTVSSKNINEIPDIIDTVVKNKVDTFAFARYCATSLEKDANIKPLEYRDLLDKCYKKFQEYKNSGTYFDYKDHLWTLYLYEKGLFKISKDTEKDIIYDGCNCGNCHITICSNGDIFACRRFESKVGNVFKDKISDVWLNEMEEYREYNKFEKCSKCELLAFCRGCPAVAYGKTHNFYSADPQCWKEV